MGKKTSLGDFESEIKRVAEEAKRDAIRRLDSEVTKRANAEMKQLAREIVGDYYSGYTPRSYKRTNQLYNVLNGSASSEVNGDTWSITITFDSDPPYGASSMHHTRPISKNGKHREPVDENAIFYSFMEGEHPSGYAEVPPTKSNNEAVAEKDIEDILDEYSENILPKYCAAAIS